MTAKLGRLAKQVPMYKLTDPTSYEFTWARMLGGGKKSITAEDQRRHHGGELELGRLGEKTTGTEPRKIGPSAEGRSANRRWSPSPVEIWSGWTLSHHCGCSRISSLLVDCYVFIFVAYFVYCKFGRTRTS